MKKKSKEMECKNTQKKKNIAKMSLNKRKEKKIKKEKKI